MLKVNYIVSSASLLLLWPRQKHVVFLSSNHNAFVSLERTVVVPFVYTSEGLK